MLPNKVSTQSNQGLDDEHQPHQTLMLGVVTVNANYKTINIKN